MSIPDFQTIMLPLLRIAADRKEHALSDVRKMLAEEFQLTPEEKAQLVPSGRQTLFDNRVYWAKAYLQMAGLVESPRHGFFCIATEGLRVLNESLEKITIKYLEQFAKFQASRKRKSIEESTQTAPIGSTGEGGTPDEVIDRVYQNIKRDAADELLEQLKNCSPVFFERLVVQLLMNMGYGGLQKDAGKVTGKSGDEGIDGVINEDLLGLDAVYLQAKKWEGTVGRPEVQKFVGALTGKKAKKGVFITTGHFADKAIAYANSLEVKVVLIDGQQLADYMIDFNIGVTTFKTYELKRVDGSYFSEE